MAVAFEPCEQPYNYNLNTRRNCDASRCTFDGSMFELLILHYSNASVNKEYLNKCFKPGWILVADRMSTDK